MLIKERSRAEGIANAKATLKYICKIEKDLEENVEVESESKK